MTDQEKRNKILKILEEAHRIWFEEYHMKPDINGIIADLLIKESENYNISEVIDRLKASDEEKCLKCIESKHTTEEEYAKLQEQFANYQLTSDKEIRAQVKQAKVDILNELKKCSCCDNFFTDGKWHRYVFVEDIDKLIEEIEK